MPDSSRIVVANGSRRLEVEGTADFVDGRLKQLLPWVQQSARTQSEGDGVASNEEPATDVQAAPTEHTTLRTFLEKKSPANIYEAIACVLYFNAKFRDRDEVSVADVRTQLVQARFRPPGNMAMALTDCRRRYGYAEPSAHKGNWKLTHDGEVAVEFDLPRTTDAKP